MRHFNIPIFIPHEGCPHNCSFCNQRKITGVTTTVKPCHVRTRIQKHLEFLPKCERRVEVAFFGGSFTGLPLSEQRSFYEVVEEFRDEIDGIRLSTRPDYIETEVLELGKRWGVTTIELGAQSAFDDVLFSNLRGHTFEDIQTASGMIQNYEIGLGLQMMTGLPESCRERDVQTGRRLAELNPDCVRIYPTLVLQGTRLEKMYQKGEYLPQSLEEAVETAKELLGIFKGKGIPVIRLGLHAGEELQEDGTIVAGPFHPAFGELVENRIWRDKVEAELQTNLPLPREYIVSVPESEISKVVGQKQCNVKYFQEKYGVSIRVKRK